MSQQGIESRETETSTHRDKPQTERREEKWEDCVDPVTWHNKQTGNRAVALVWIVREDESIKNQPQCRLATNLDLNYTYV